MWSSVPLPTICRPKQWPTIPKAKLLSAGYTVFGANGRIGYYSEYNHEEPTILITCRGATCGSINVCDAKSYVTGNAMALDELDEGQADLRYLTHALESADFSRVITGVAQPQITGQSLARLQVPLPPLAEQKRIAGVLDAADALRAKRRESLTQLDTLLQSTFLDMFGDPVTNPMGWDTDQLGNICDLLNGYAFKSGDYVETSNTLSCRMSNIRPGGSFDLSYNPRYLPDEYAKKFERYLLRDGDVVIAMTDLADSPKILGVPTIVRPNGKFVLLNQRVGKLTLQDEGKCHFEYFRAALNWPSTREIYKKFAGGGLQINLGKRDLLSVTIPLPPLDLQHRFAAIVESVEQQKAHHLAHLAELDTLFASLQSRAFRGDL